LPTVLIFTIPMAVLCGTIIGLGRMSSDSELVGHARCRRQHLAHARTRADRRD
jgi:hypothetical protein